ncbi:MAG: TraB/GumN family protein [Burkholderiales bacterium]
MKMIPDARQALRWFAVMVLACGTNVHAQAPASCPPVATPFTQEEMQSGLRSARDRGFLWRITREGRDSWLYGTVHAAKRDWMFPGPNVTQALKASDAIALELDLQDPEIGRRLGAGMAAQRNAPLPEPLRQRLARLAEAECIPAPMLAPLSPEMQVATLSVLAARRDGIDPSYGIDAVIGGFGRGSGKPVVSLETPEQQLRVLQMPSPQETLSFVESGVQDLESGRARPLVLRLTQAWADADLDTLSGYASWCDCLNTEADRAQQARLLDARNPPLADAIAALHNAGKRVFAAVGSLHMIGPLGLPGLLAERGFSVERVHFSP